MAVDLLRSCYKTRMRFFTYPAYVPNEPDSGSVDGVDPYIRLGYAPYLVETPVRWFFVEDSAKNLPFPTAFGSANWEEWEDLNSPLGESRLNYPNPWSNGNRPTTATGVGPPCGTAAQFAGGFDISTFTLGVPYNPEGLPTCCGANVYLVDVALSGNIPPASGIRLGGAVMPLTQAQIAMRAARLECVYLCYAFERGPIAFSGVVTPPSGLLLGGSPVTASGVVLSGPSVPDAYSLVLSGYIPPSSVPAQIVLSASIPPGPVPAGIVLSASIMPEPPPAGIVLGGAIPPGPVPAGIVLTAAELPTTPPAGIVIGGAAPPGPPPAAVVIGGTVLPDSPPAGIVIGYTAPTPPPTEYVLDTYTAADGTLATSRAPDVGPTPTSSSGDYVIESDSLTNPTNSSLHSPMVYDTTESDGTITVDLYQFHLNNDWSTVVFRYVDDNNFWFIDLEYFGNVVVAYYQSGIWRNALATGTGYTSGNHVYKVVLAGASINVYIDGALIGSFSNTFNQTATAHGVLIYNAAGAGGQSIVDNFEFGP